MSSLIKETSQFQLTPEKLEKILTEITVQLKNRVEEAYVFGSAATDSITSSSDIDLILVLKESQTPFVQRAFEFADLFDIYPKLDLLVYTQKEFEAQLADSEIGFWKSVRLSMKKLLPESKNK